MSLVPNWRAVVFHSWSFRINVAVAFTSALEAASAFVVKGELGAAAVVAGCSLVAAVARLVRQATVSGDGISTP